MFRRVSQTGRGVTVAGYTSDTLRSLNVDEDKLLPTVYHFLRIVVKSTERFDDDDFRREERRKEGANEPSMNDGKHGPPPALLYLPPFPYFPDFSR